MNAEPRNSVEPGPESSAPDGILYRIPSTAEARASFREISEAATAHRAGGGQVVVVQGLGFVGSAVAAAVAGATNAESRPFHYVIGVDLPSPESYWKVAKINEGNPPFRSPDQTLTELFHQTVHERGNLRATTCEEAYALADVVVVDVHLDVENRVAERADEIRVRLEGFQSALRAVGRHMPADALVLIETTVPMGTCERIALPILREERARRGIREPVLLANAYERVMPGPGYVDSIRALSRTFAGIDQESAERAETFLKTVIDTDGHPLWQLEDTVSSELGKLLENSYRSVNIAFIHEWTLLAEQIGVNLFEIVDSIRVRKGTHDNMRYPGFGVGGYCLTKDSLLAQWSAAHLFEADVVLGMTLGALRTNYEMPLHTFDLVEELADSVAGKTIAVLGVSYLAGVADTRNSPTEILVDRLLEADASLRVHDPLVATWYERPEIDVLQDLSSALAEASGVVFAVPHDAYLALASQELLELIAPHAFVVDAQNIVSDEKARALHEAGRRVVGVGKGHWRTRGYHVDERRA